MNPEIAFKAPWGRSLKISTVLGACILVGIPALGLYYSPGAAKPVGHETLWILGMVVLPLSILLGAAAFAIRGYELSGNTLYVLRPGWRTEVGLNGLQAADADPQAMKRSIRLMGNGGLFSVTGRFRNKRLGLYRAFVTNPERAVVLKFPGYVIVVTPDQPARFVECVKSTHRLS